MTGEGSTDCLHATAVQLRCADYSAGVLLLGPSGSGKSSLALGLIDQPGHGLASSDAASARLVSDDQVVLTRSGPSISMTAPAGLSGLLEVRGVGIVRLQDVCPSARLDIVVEHQPAAGQERLPKAAHTVILDQRLPLYLLDLASPGAASRIRLLAQLHWGQLRLQQ